MHSDVSIFEREKLRASTLHVHVTVICGFSLDGVYDFFLKICTPRPTMDDRRMLCFRHVSNELRCDRRYRDGYIYKYIRRCNTRDRQLGPVIRVRISGRTVTSKRAAYFMKGVFFLLGQENRSNGDECVLRSFVRESSTKKHGKDIAHEKRLGLTECLMEQVAEFRLKLLEFCSS